jgi:hypothetical protein
MDFNRYETLSPRKPSNALYVWRSYDIDGDVVVNRGVRNIPGNILPAEHPLASYAPSQYPELPQVLAQVHLAQDALAFVRQYGLLGHDEMAPPEKHRGGDPLDWFLCHAATVRLLLELTRALEQKDVDALEKCLNVGGNHAHVDIPPAEVDFLGESFAWIRYAVRHEIVSQTGFGILGRDILTFARAVRRQIINANIRRVYSYLHEVEGDDIILEGINALIESVYQHVADIVTQHRKVRRCAAPDCRRLFVQRTKRQKFCPPDPRQKDSRCAERVRGRRKKQR